MTEPADLPDTIDSEQQLEDLLSRPSPEAVAALSQIPGDLLVLGAGGKTGPSLARMAERASRAGGAARRVIAVSRFTRPGLRELLERDGVETIACDLLQRDQLAALPDAPNVLYLAAMKFGATGQEATTWAMNTLLPGWVAQRFAASRIVAYSTGNVYAMVPPDSGGSVETDRPAPRGEYAMSCLGKERALEYFSRTRGTPVALVRLNYANEPRYGVLVDLAQHVLAGAAIDLTMGYFNAIWQGDSNAMTLAAFAQAATPPRLLNVAGAETLSVREVAQRLGRLLGKAVRFTGSESPDAFLNNAHGSYPLLGRPRVPLERLLGWIVAWLTAGGPTLGKPTHFQTRDGKF